MNSTATVTPDGTLTIHHLTCGHTQTVRAATICGGIAKWGSAADYCDNCGEMFDYEEMAPTPTDIPAATNVRVVEVIIPVAVGLRIAVDADGNPVDVLGTTGLRLDYDTAVNYGNGEVWDDEAEEWRCPTSEEVAASDTALARALGFDS